MLKEDIRPFEEIGMKVGSHHTRCPAHGGSDSVSCNIQRETGHIVWKCHACEAGGTIIDAWSHHYDMSTAEALKDLGDRYDHGDGNFEKFEIAEPELVELQPTDTRVLRPSRIYDKPSATFRVNGDVMRLRYDQAKFWAAACLVDGKVWAAGVMRWDLGSEKIIRQVHFEEGNGWVMKGFPHKPIPMYKLDQIEEYDHIYYVEGETCMDALQAECDRAHIYYEDLFPKTLVVTHPGGSKKVNYVDLEPLRGKNITIFRDNDGPGLEMARSIQRRVGGKIINVAKPTDKAGYDVKDWIEENNDIRDLLDFEEEKTQEDLYDQEVSLIERRLMEVVDASPIQQDRTINDLADSTDISKGALRAQLKEYQKATSIDWPEFIAQKTVNEAYNKKIVNIDGNLWFYDGRKWGRQVDDVVKRSIYEIAQKYLPASENDTEKVLRKSFPIIRAICAKEGDYLRLRHSPKPIINLRNGELHINDDGTTELKQHSPESLLTYCLEVDYDPEAECPEWDKAILEIMRHRKEDVRHLEEVCGYLLQPKRDMKNYFMWFGAKGHNGKSSVSRVLSSLIGLENILAVEIDKFGQGNHDNDALVGKILVMDDDVKKGVKLNDGLLKTISEEKMLTANPKGKSTFQFTSYAAVLLLSNHWPTTSDLTKAMLTRANIIPFEAYFDPEDPNTDKNLFRRIKENELSGVLNRFIAGLRRLRMRGTWDYPQSCEAAKEAWLKETSNLYLYVSTHLIEDPTEDITMHELRDSYRSWCMNQGVDSRWIASGRSLKRSIEDMGYEIAGANNNDGGWKIVNHSLLR